MWQIVDPVDVTVERDSSLVKELGLTLQFAINTHVHADHVTGTGLLKVCRLGCVLGVLYLSLEDSVAIGHTPSRTITVCLPSR